MCMETGFSQMSHITNCIALIQQLHSVNNVHHQADRLEERKQVEGEVQREEMRR